MILLDQRVVSFAEDLAGFVADDYTADRRTALVVTLFCQEHADAHEVPVRELPEEAVFDNLRESPCREIGDEVEDFVCDGSVFADEELH